MPDPTPYPLLCVGLTPCLQRTLRFSQLRPGEVNRARQVTVTASGKATNVARVAASLKAPVLLTGFTGGDTGAQFRARLEPGTHRFVETSQPTRICQTLIDEAAGQVTELVEESPLPAPKEWEAFSLLFDELLTGTEWMVISGSPPPGSSPDIYYDLILKANRTGCRVIIDAQKQPLRAALAAKPFMVKLNREELATTLRRPIDSENDLRAGCCEILEAGVQSVLVTRGAQPALYVDAKQTYALHPPRVKPVNPIGSGDAMAGGIAAGLLRGDPLEFCLKQGVACGAANALSATSGVVDPEEVVKLFPEVKIEQQTTGG